MPIMVTRSSMPPFEEYCEEIRKLWDSHWLTNMGIEHETLEAELEKYLDCPQVVLFTNGHLALENAMAAFEFPKESEVITTPFTFVSTTHAIVRNGLVPVFCDVNPQDYTLDVTKLEALITEKTVAIAPVHVYGHFCNVEEIKRIADAHGLKVIYDAAHAFGETYKGVSGANYGDAAMFSFHATKVFNTIEGGAICTSDPKMAEVLCDMKNFGIRNPESTVFVGGNAKMNEFQAAMGICNLRHLEEEIAKRKGVAERYRENLAGRKDLILSAEQENVTSNYTYMPVVFPDFEGDCPEEVCSETVCSEVVRPGETGAKHRRDIVYEKLKENGIIARKYFYPLTNDLECYADYPTAGKEKTPVAAWLADRVLTLPLYADLSLEDVDLICSLL